MNIVPPPRTSFDFSRLNEILYYSHGPNALCLMQGLVVVTQRHGQAYAAVVIAGETHFNAVREILAEDWGFSNMLARREWYPYRIGRTAEEAIGAVLDFLNTKLTRDRQELINWAGNCMQLEYYLTKGEDGCFDERSDQVPADWKLSAAEAYIA